MFMMNDRGDNRVSWIDMAKGYGTLLVIYAHLGADPLRTWMYGFHLPLFFFLSGYVFRADCDFKCFFVKKCKSIVVPYFCLGIPMLLFECLKAYIYGYLTLDWGISLGRAFLEQKRMWTLWFIACLFVLNLLFFWIVKICKKEWMIIVISVVFPLVGLYYYGHGGEPWYWNADACFMAMPFFGAGYLYKLHVERVDAFVGKWKGVLFLGSAVINILAWTQSLDENGMGLEMFESNYGNPVFTYLAAFAGIVCVILISKGFVFEPIRFIGENSMLYYAWHQTIMLPIMQKIVEYMGGNVLLTYGDIGYYIYKIVLMAGILICTTACFFVINKLGFNFVLGKNKRYG